jgi:hypothetical protein
MGEAIQAALCEGRRLSHDVPQWTSFVRSSLAAWRDHMQRRDRRLEQRQAAQQQRDDAVKEKRRQEMEGKKEGIMERIRLMKEKALADAARSEVKTRGWKPPPPSSSSSPSPEQDDKVDERPLVLPKIKLAPVVGIGSEEPEEPACAKVGSPVERFALMEAVEEASINLKVTLRLPLPLPIHDFS